MNNIVELQGLPGVRRKRVRAVMCKSIAGVMAVFMTTTKAATGAGDYGAVNVYVDDDGLYQCQFMVYHSVVNAGTFTTKSDVRKWLSEWWPQCRQRQAA